MAEKNKEYYWVVWCTHYEDEGEYIEIGPHTLDSAQSANDEPVACFEDFHEADDFADELEEMLGADESSAIARTLICSPTSTTHSCARRSSA